MPAALGKKKKVLGVILAALILLALTYWFTQRGSSEFEITEVPKNYKLHNYPGESLLDINSYPPVNESNKVVFEGHSYEMRLTFDKPAISPTPGSTITGTVAWLEDGKPLKKRPAWTAKKPNQAFPVAVTVIDGKMPNPYQRRLSSQRGNPAGIEAANGAEALWVRTMPASIQPITGGNLTVDGKTQQSDRSAETQLFHLRRQAGMASQAYSANLLGGSIVYGDFVRTEPVHLEIIDGEASFTYQFDGTRILPFVQFRVDSSWIRDDRDVLAVSRAVFFEDQVGRVSTKPVRQQDKSDIYYEVATDKDSLRKGQAGSIKLSVATKETKTNQIATDKQQRVRISVRPATNIFQLTRVEKGQNPTSTTSDGVPMKEFLQLLSYPLFLGKTEATTYGRFGNVLAGTEAKPVNALRPTMLTGDAFIKRVRESLADWLAMFNLQVDQLTIDQPIKGLDEGSPSAIEALRVVLVGKIRSQVDTEEAGGNSSGLNSVIPPFMSGEESFQKFYQDWKSGEIPAYSPQKDPRYIDIDLEDGRAEVEFIYNGKIGNQPLLTFEVQAIPVKKYPGSSPEKSDPDYEQAIWITSNVGAAGLYRNWLTLEDPVFGTHTIYQLPIK